MKSKILVVLFVFWSLVAWADVGFEIIVNGNGNTPHWLTYSGTPDTIGQIYGAQTPAGDTRTMAMYQQSSDSTGGTEQWWVTTYNNPNSWGNMFLGWGSFVSFDAGVVVDSSYWTITTEYNNNDFAYLTVNCHAAVTYFDLEVHSVCPTDHYSPTITESDGGVIGPYGGTYMKGDSFDEILWQVPTGTTATVSWADNPANGNVFMTGTNVTLPNLPVAPDMTNPVTDGTGLGTGTGTGIGSGTPDQPVSGQPGLGQGIGTNVFGTLPSPVIWSGAPVPIAITGIGTGTGTATSGDISKLGMGLNQTLWSAAATENKDLSGVIGAINAAGATAHADAGSIKASVDTVKAQLHSDLEYVAGLLYNITNGSTVLNTTNLATDSTLRGVGTNLVSSLDTLNSSVLSVGTNFSVTGTNIANGLYAIYTNIFALSTNLDGIPGALLSNGVAVAGSVSNLQGTVSQLGSGLTNLNATMSNLVVAMTNLTDVSNLDFATEATQIGISNLIGILNSNLWASSTNGGFRMTNYASESTLEGISNLLAKAGQHDMDTNGMMSQIWGATNAGAGVAAGTLAGRLSGSTAIQDTDGGGGGSLDVDLGHGINLPLSSTSTAPFGVCRSIIMWFLYFSVFVACWKMFHDTVMASLTVPQAGTAGQSVAGFNANFASALAMAGAIVGVVSAITVAALPMLLNYFTYWFGIDPFAGIKNWAYGWLTTIIPLGAMLSACVVLVAFRVLTNVGGQVAGGVIKFLVGI